MGFSRRRGGGGALQIGARGVRLLRPVGRRDRYSLQCRTPVLLAAVGESGAAPIGPFVLCDILGLDTVLHVAEYLEQSYGERFYVHGLMRELVAAGDLGVKTGKGFYEHRR